MTQTPSCGFTPSFAVTTGSALLTLDAQNMYNLGTTDFALRGTNTVTV